MPLAKQIHNPVPIKISNNLHSNGLVVNLNYFLIVDNLFYIHFLDGMGGCVRSLYTVNYGPH